MPGSCDPDCPNAPGPATKDEPQEPARDLTLGAQGLLERADQLTGGDTGDPELAGWLDAIEEAVYRVGASIVATLEEQTKATEVLTRVMRHRTRSESRGRLGVGRGD